VLNKLIATLADEDVSFAEVGALIEKDSVLAGNVLRIVNSAIYGRRGTVNSVRHAVSLLGLAKVRNAAMAASVGQMWGRMDAHPKWSAKQFNIHSTAVALLADRLAVELPVNYPEGAFTAGLLSGVGLLLTAISLKNEFDALQRSQAAPQGAVLLLAEGERTVFGFTHADLSGDVLTQWSLPLPIQAAVRQSADPAGTSPTKLAEVVWLSVQVATHSGFPLQPWVHEPPVEPAAILAEAGLEAQASELIAAFQAEVEALLPLFDR
jgi:HD-like signal output (HDOD) protein